VGKHGVKDTIREGPDCPDIATKVDCWRTVSQLWTLSEQEGTSGEGWLDVCQTTDYLSQFDAVVESKQRLVSREVGWMAAEKDVYIAKN